MIWLLCAIGLIVIYRDYLLRWCGYIRQDEAESLGKYPGLDYVPPKPNAEPEPTQPPEPKQEFPKLELIVGGRK